jgi:adenylylsulfate kinase
MKKIVNFKKKKNQFFNASCYWITGLSASGKSTMANMLTDYLKKKNKPVIMLDGDILRDIFNVKAYSLEERYKLGLKFSALCKLIVENDINVVIGIIGLFHKLHSWNKKNIPNYCEIFLNVPKEELIHRDPKGIYKKALKGQLKNVMGIDLKVEFPLKPDIEITWVTKKNVDDTFKEIIEKINVKTK